MIKKPVNQYEKKYKCFHFIGPSPIDYDSKIAGNKCVWEELCKFDLEKQIEKGKNKIGIIFNLDKHYQSGSHWVSLFVDLRDKKKPTIEYFNSSGNAPLSNFKNLMEKLKEKFDNCLSESIKIIRVTILGIIP